MINGIHAKSKNDINKPIWFIFANEDQLQKTMQTRFIDSDLIKPNTYAVIIIGCLDE